MTSSPSRLPALSLITLTALALGLTGTGCTQYGCFEYTQEEYDAFGGCPSQDDALQYFGDPSCGGSVESVDSDGEYEEGYCCYEITKLPEGEYRYSPSCGQ
jgi:hypothetical protein